MRTKDQALEEATKIVDIIDRLLTNKDITQLKSKDEYDAIELFCDEVIEYLEGIKKELCLLDEDDEET